MPYSDFVAGLVTQLNTVAAPQPLTVLDHPPTAIETEGGVYIQLRGFERNNTKKTIVYDILVRVCIPWQENQQATTLIAGYVNTVPAAIETDVHLAGDATKTLVVSGSTGWITIAGVEYHICDFTIEGFEQAQLGAL